MPCSAFLEEKSCKSTVMNSPGSAGSAIYSSSSLSSESSAQPSSSWSDLNPTRHATYPYLFDTASFSVSSPNFSVCLTLSDFQKKPKKKSDSIPHSKMGRSSPPPAPGLTSPRHGLFLAKQTKSSEKRFKQSRKDRNERGNCDNITGWVSGQRVSSRASSSRWKKRGSGGVC